MVGASYTVQILVPRAVQLDPDELLRRMTQWRDDIELVLDGRTDRLVFEIPTHDLPLFAFVYEARPDAFADSLRDARTWTPWWHEGGLRDDAAARAASSVVVELSAQRPINQASMLLAFLATLDAVVFALPEAERAGAVLHWLPAQQLLSIERYRALRTDHGPCGPAVNVRIAGVAGRPGELLADTIGLANLGLPDLQFVSANGDPAEIELRLRLLVRSMFVGDRLDCGWIEETSFVPPARDALTLQLE
jgi:hypothetical protein